jgi:cytochrome c-type biogenesis protein CcmF
MTMPIVVCLLFLMAVAPVLPWRRASGELLRTRLLWPAALAVLVLVACVAFGVRGFNPLLAFTLGTFAGVTALRQLFLEVRRHRLRGLLGASGGGMVVHVGVVVVAVAFAASHSFTHQRQFTLAEGASARFAGHSFTYVKSTDVVTSTHTALDALVRVDDSYTLRPAVSNYPFASEAIGTPAVHSGPWEDLYLTMAATPTAPGGSAVIDVYVEPLVMWIWVGGGIMFAGTFLAAVSPVVRRRARAGTPSPDHPAPEDALTASTIGVPASSGSAP